MRRNVKRQLLELAGSIKDAHKEILKLLKKRDTAAVINALADCSDAAAVIAENFDNEPAELQTRIIAACEKYREVLFDISGALPSAEALSVSKRVSEAFVPVETALSAIKPRLEIVFFPYKSSMWDSLESVWRAADADPECDAFVVPIPYYAKNPDGTFGQMSYEGGNFPDYVPVVPYTRYDLPSRLPDIAYIHNPYDEANYVTSVHPDYYSKEIKKYADKLIYVPYFISNGTSLGSFAAVAVSRADVSVMQSERLAKFVQTQSRGKTVIALGSPKIDSVLSDAVTFSDRGKLPKEWQSKFENKKIIFFNPHLNCFINYPYHTLSWLIQIFDEFRQREDLVLLWRPPPLTLSTLRAMRAEYADAYLKIVSDYISSGAGIYDDSPDFRPALGASDGYYGSGSSLLTLFGFTGKPMVHHLVHSAFAHVPPGKLLMPVTGQIADGILYFVTRFNSLLFSADLSASEGGSIPVRFCGALPADNIARNLTFLSSDYAEAENKIYFAPMNAPCISIYDITAHSFSNVPLSGEYTLGYSAFCGVHVIPDERTAYFIPCRYGAIAALNLDTYSIKYLPLNKKTVGLDPARLPLYSAGETEVFCGSVLVRDTIYMTCPQGGAVVAFNTKTRTGRVLFSGADHRYSHIAASPEGGCLWLAPDGARITGARNTAARYDIGTGKITVYTLSDKAYASVGVHNNKHAYFSSSFGKELIEIDPDKPEHAPAAAMKIADKGFDALPLNGGAVFFGEYKGGLLFVSAADRHVYLIDGGGSASDLGSLDLTDEDLRRAQECLLTGSEQESKMFSTFLNSNQELVPATDLLASRLKSRPVSDAQKRAYAALAVNTDGSAGAHIHKYAKGLLK